MAGDAAQELYQQFETAVRTPKRRLLIDALLPDAAAIPSSLPVAPPPPTFVAEDFALPDRDRDRDVEEERPRPRRKTRPAAARRKEAPQSLEEEVAEFMNRDRGSAKGSRDGDQESGDGPAPKPDPPDPDPKSD